jgi:hypothetical protein
MVSSSKILTVSYGTFSCTLEGFDDSFDTMKAIAEYFRNLAADDRYFGAEPPTPDAEMLARIAEREISQRVDASEQEGKIVLRAADDAALSAPSEDEAPQAQDDQSAEDDADALQAREEEPPAPATETQAEPAPDHDEIAEAPQIEAEAPETEPEIVQEPVAAERTEAEPEPAISAAMPGFDADETGQDIAETIAPEPEPEMEAEPVAEMEPEPETATVAAPVTEPEPEIAEEPVAIEEPVVEEPVAEASDAIEGEDGDSVADRLRRIRSLVDGSEAEFQDSDYSEDEHAQDFLSETAADLDQALSVDDAVETAARDEAEGPDLSSLPEAADSGTSEPDIAAAVEAPEIEASQESETKAAAPELAEDTLAQLLADAMPESGERAEAMQEEVGDDTPAEERPAVQARVVKMKRSEFEAAISEGYIEEDDDDDDLGENLFGDDSGLSAEEEADLRRELAEVEAEFKQPEERDEAPLRLTEADQIQDEAEDTAEQDETPEPAEVEEDTQTPRGISKLQHAERQADLARIFDEADTQLEEPESNQRRNAIQHLRAAVAATRAENKAGASLKEDVDESPYRNDLADVVRPRRPEAGEGRQRASRPNVQATAPAPLKLVAEQRVDVESTPVRPRRISTAKMPDAETLAPNGDVDGTFTDFADEMGAKGLPELLEAAAAYMSDVEGRAQFSRPMLMGKLKEVEGREFSREDGLRSFGQLLRQGKLQKLKGGRFCVTDSTDFRAEERNAG